MPRLLLIFILLKFINFNSTAQVFQMSSIQKLGENSYLSQPITFTSSLKCIDIQTGISLFTAEQKTDEFIIVCELPLDLKDIYIQIYPNPVSSNALVKFSKQIPLDDIYTVSLYNMSGILVFQQLIGGQQLIEGFPINLQYLPLGTYLISIESSLFQKGAKILKAN